MTTAFAKDQNLEKQMQKQTGCMTGFLHIFDRHQILSGRRLYSAKRLPPSSPVTDTTSESEKSAPPSPAPSELNKQPPPLKSPLRLPVLELKEGSRSPWKFGKETPRLSLDSRATTDAKGGLHPKEIRTAAAATAPSSASDAADDGQQHQRSPSVIARLMGLEPLLPNSTVSEAEAASPQLRRSASESRVTRDLFQSRFVAEKPAQPPQSAVPTNGAKDPTRPSAYLADPRLKIAHKAEPPKGLPWKFPQHHRKSFFDSGDFFPEPKQTASVYGEIEHRLRIRGIDETSKDLETLKQILEALQLKGLLHSGKSPERNLARNRNFVYEELPVPAARPRRPSNSSPINRRNQVRGVQRNYSFPGENSPPVSPRSVRSPSRSERSPSPTSSVRREGNANGRRSNSLAKPKPLTVETQRRENRRVSPVHSPKLNQRGTGPGPKTSTRKKSTAEIQRREKTTVDVGAEDESSSISESSTITTSTDNERSKAEECKEGRHLLDRCDKLLHSIAEMASSDMQPSPVSVLDSSFYKDESFTPSPVTTRRNIDFKGQSGETEEYEIWSSPVFPPDGPDFAYVSDILRASHYLREEDESDVFHLLEKQQLHQGGHGDHASKVSRLQRKLVFDTVNEILDRDRRLPPWKVVTLTNQDLTTPSLNRVWSEFERIRKCDPTEDLFDTVCGVLKKDLVGDAVHGWGDCPAEMSEAVLDIERLIFKDLIVENIRDLAALARERALMMPRRKLVF